MGLTVKNLIVAMLLIIIATPSTIYSQNQSCDITAPFSPDLVQAKRHPSVVQEMNHFLGKNSWNNLENARVADDQYLSVDLERYDRTHVLRFSGFDFNVPDLATINGLQIAIEGQSIGEGQISQMQLQLYSNGPVGNNVADLPSLLGTEWINDSLAYDRWWKYGYYADTWDKEWSASEVNSEEFGFVIQIENQTDEFVRAIIDQVAVSVFYTPPHNLCAHECIVFSTERIDGVENFQWEFPSNFEQIYSETNQHILNLNVIDNIEGSYQVCVTPEGHDRCCMDFVIMDCTLGSVGNLVWKDANSNGVQDNGESGIAGVRVQLFNESGFFLEDQFTDSNGNYLFTDLYAGNYKIKTSEPTDDCEVSTSPNPDENTNSDYDLAYGPMCSDFFSIDPGQHRDDIDFGWSFKFGSIAGCVFRDRNGDSSITDDPGIPNVMVTLHQCDGTVVTSTITNADGRYTFENLPVGQYFVSTPETAGMIAAIGGDSAFGEGTYNSSCVEVVPNESQEIKLGYIPLGQLGNYVFFDENENGIHENLDWPIAGLQLFLFDNANQQVATTITGVDGLYLFDNLPAGQYCVVANYPSVTYLPTVLNPNDDPSMDSNGTDIGNLQVKSEIINLFDGESNLTIDFGFIKRTASITGTYFSDSEGDGSFAGNAGIHGATVGFYNCDGAIIATRTTDESGQFTFTGFVGQNYHLVFSPIGGMMTSTLGESQIDNIITEGATACFVVQDESTITINGGSIPFSRIGDRVWEDVNRNGIYDNNEPGMENVELRLIDTDDQLLATTITNSEGIYIFDNVLPGNCYIEVKAIPEYEITESNIGSDESLDSDGIMINGVISSEVFSLINGTENMDVDFGFRRTGGSINGRLWSDGNGDNIYGNESGIANRTIRVKTCQGTEITSTITNSEGIFSFSPIVAGEYYLEVENVDGEVFAIGSDSDLKEDGTTNCFTVTNGASLETLLGVIPTSDIGDYIWLDQNRNGIQDVDETGMPSVYINLMSESGEEIGTTWTNQSGIYSFENIPASNYYLQVETPMGYNLTQSNIGDFDTDSEGAVTGNFIQSSMFALRDGVDQFDHDFGFFQSTSSLNGSVWSDANGDLLNNDQNGLEGISVTLYSCDLVLLNSTLTNSDGSFGFENLLEGDFFVVVNNQADFEILSAGDSDVNNVIMAGATSCVTVSPSNSNNISIGYIPLASIGDYVWLDENENGLQDVDENGIAEVVVGLIDNSGELIDNTITDTNGFYQFDNLIPGEYRITINLSNEDYSSTLIGAGNNTQDSEGTLMNNVLTSDVITLFNGVDQLDHDFGFIEIEGIDPEPEFGVINGTFVRDRNGDGILTDDPGIAGAIISLKTCAGEEVTTATTDQQGAFSFTNLEAGNYYIVFPTEDNFVLLNTGESQINNLIEQGSSDCITVVANTSMQITGGAVPLNSIGDYVWNDTNEDGIQDDDEQGFENILISLFDENDNFIAEGLSDTNGAYQFNNLMPGNYYIIVSVDTFEISPSQAVANEEIDSDLLLIDGIAVAGPIILTDGISLSNLDFGLYIEEVDNGGGNNTGGGSDENVVAGIVYEDVNGNGILDSDDNRRNGVSVSLVFSTGAVLDNTTSMSTDLEEGYYEFSGFPNGDYTLVFDLESTSTATGINVGTNTEIDSDIVLENEVFQTETLSFEDGTEITGVNAGYYYPVSIGDYVWFDFNGNGLQDDDEPGANDYIVRLFDETGQQLLMTTTGINPLTDENGFYLFNNLKPGNYYVGLNLNFGTSVTIENAGDDNLDSDVDNSNGAGTTATISLTSGEQRGNVDIGLQSSPGSIGNLLWIDNNGNGVQDNGEPGVNDATVNLYDDQMNFVRSTITTDDSDGEPGYYLFDNVPIGDYFVVFDLPEGYLATAAFRGGNTSNDSDVTNLIQDGSSNIFSIGSGVFSDDIDCGIYQPAFVGNYIWNDIDLDGTQEFGEFGVEDVEVAIFREGEGEIDRTTTNNNGMYMFEDLRPGNYFIFVEKPDGFQFTQVYSGNDDTIDSNIDMTGTSEVFALDQEDVITSIDVGLIPARATIGGRTWEDDGNGLQDFVEESITGVTVHLLDANMEILETTTTNVLGRYAFTNLSTADHFIQFEAPAGFIFTVKDQSFNDNEDSDAEDNGLTDAIAVTSVTSMLNVDAGFVFVGFTTQLVEDIQLSGFHENGISRLTWTDENFEEGDKYALLRSGDGLNFEMISMNRFDKAYDMTYNEDTNKLVESNYSYKVVKYIGANAIAVSNIWNDDRVSKFQVEVFPNPASEFIEIEFDQYEEGEVKIQIMDIYGNKLQTETFKNLTAGNVNLEVQLDQLANGIYILQVDMGRKMESRFINILK